MGKEIMCNELKEAVLKKLNGVICILNETMVARQGERASGYFETSGQRTILTRHG